MNFKIVLCVRAYPIPFHTTILHETLLRLKGGGGQDPRRNTNGLRVMNLSIRQT
jgi:hypothetical protein